MTKTRIKQVDPDEDIYIDDRQDLQLHDAIEEFRASPAKIAARFGIRLKAVDFAECLRMVRRGEFSRR